MYKRWIKRAFDISVASAVLVVCAPLMLVLSVLIRVIMGGPILFRQMRPGFNGQPFTCLKFRTMAADAEKRLQQYHNLWHSDIERFRLPAWICQLSIDQ